MKLTRGIALKLILAVVLMAVAAAAQTATPTRAPDVPYVPTTEPAVEAMLKLAKVGRSDVVYDLGCGDGRIVIAAARKFGARGVGIDINPERIAEARANAKKAGVEHLVKFIEQDLFEADIREASVVTLFLLNHVNMKLKPKLLADLKPGTRVVSNTFDMGDWKADVEQSLDDSDAGYLSSHFYLWIIPRQGAK
ncbi:MAG: class I SAM-dependent methyltransferase [Bryobacteraceae bacterium]|nr:class I SAM-dependent methyltransferase [Solibacteraceae bacterium]MCL4844651.1 methyltransferase domain-containing protein [Bryobacteraceae bacterium]MCO5353784.1 class I SAM-dependent methyltransferase [Bryobacteraceae bacterium]